MNKARMTAETALETVHRCTAALSAVQGYTAPLREERRRALALLASYHARGIITTSEYEAAKGGKNEKGVQP